MTVQYDLISHMKQDPNDPTSDHGLHPLAFSARANAEDTPKFHEAMASPDREGFIQAMHKEYGQLEEIKAWKIVPRSRAIQQHKNVLSTTWAFKQKCFPDRSVKKLKARICVCGDQQVQDVDYFDTFSPVIQWSTIRLMFILSIMLNLKTI